MIGPLLLSRVVIWMAPFSVPQPQLMMTTIPAKSNPHSTLHMVLDACSLDALRTDSETPGRLQPTPSEGRQSWHYDTLSSPQLPSDTFTISDDYGPDGTVGR